MCNSQDTIFDRMQQKRLHTILKEGKEFIFDPIRKKYVFLTPEEWVRQQIVDHLIYEQKIPRSLIAVEKKVQIGNLSKRFDILVFKNSIPWMIIECKRESELLNESVMQQILAYNSQLKVAYLVVSNGKEVYCFDTKENAWQDGFAAFHITE